ncbi:hypothetical protein ETAA8_29080 [Anatilimnocola aggregata]|uniref:Anti-sigma factor n=1 Tax=Anatilimnocola aggregata TaxID=2528021 RepID=A0A517YC46_9BACT|nr:hypothetical protein [Anatilimnocola aggregata]QDU27817.1 hypothetical protein ETAA8_29080 [Anatilimnocola aggregata]
MPNQPNIEPQDELAWLAFRYVAGELTAAETEQFELQLAVDQRARETLAQTVELYHAVAAAESLPTIAACEPARRQTTSRTQQVAWISAGVSAATLLLMAGWSAGWFFGPSSVPSANINVAHVSPELAAAWNELRAEATVGDDELSDDELASLPEDELSISTEAPSWMTAAVLGIAGHDPALPVATPLDAAESRPQEN